MWWKYFSCARPCVLSVPRYRTTSKWLPAAWGRCASIVLKFPGLKWGTHASLWHSKTWPCFPGSCLTRGNRRAADQGPFLDSFCDRLFLFSCVSHPDKCSLELFPHMIYSLFILQPGKGKKVKPRGVENRNRSNIAAVTNRLLGAAEIVCVYLLERVCLQSTQAVQMRPLLQMERLIWRQQQEKWKIKRI